MTRGTVKRIGLLCLVMGGLVGYVLWDSRDTLPLFSKVVLGFVALLLGCVFYMCGVLTKENRLRKPTKRANAQRYATVDEVMKRIDAKMDAKVKDVADILDKKYATSVPIDVPMVITQLNTDTKDTSPDVQKPIYQPHEVRKNGVNQSEVVTHAFTQLLRTENEPAYMDERPSTWMGFSEALRTCNYTQRYLKDLVYKGKILHHPTNKKLLNRASFEQYRDSH